MVITKPWGQSSKSPTSTPYRHIFNNIILPNGYCSFHYHAHKFNVFNLVKGDLRIIALDGLNLIYKDLDINKHHAISPHIPHMFYSKSGCELIEYYYCSAVNVPDEDDIVRFTSSGIGPYDDVIKSIMINIPDRSIYLL